MVTNRDVTEPMKKHRLLRTLCGVFFLLVAVGCFQFWPVSENPRLLAQASRVVYHASARAVRSQEASRLLHFYGTLMALRISEPYSSRTVASASSDCRTGGDTGLTSLFSSRVVTATTVPGATNCQMLPVIAEEPSKLAKRVNTVPVLPVQASHPNDTASNTTTAQSVAITLKPQGPVQLTSLRDRATCNQGVSLNIVAHEDDDLLFMNPDIQSDISAGKCVRTVYMTAGDAGQTADYWNGREQGAKAAYAAMYHVDNIWSDEQQLIYGRLTDVSYLQDVPQVSLIFMQLPDGNLFGQGFAATGNESLDKLVSGQIDTIHTVSDKIAYSKDDILAALQSIMEIDAPQVIRTQNPQGKAGGDHADHAAVATLAGLASDVYPTAHTLVQYAGYPDKKLEANLSINQIASKQAAFFAYALHDGAVCQSPEACAKTATYGHYLKRQYQIAQVASGQ